MGPCLQFSLILTDIDTGAEGDPTPGMSRALLLLLYAQRRISALRPREIARRYGRRPSAVTMAVRAPEAQARADRALARKLSDLSVALGNPIHEK